MRLFSILLFLIIALKANATAEAQFSNCGYKSVPIDLVVERERGGLFSVDIIAPIYHEDGYLHSMQFNKAANQISMYEGYREEGGVAIYFIRGYKDFLQDSEISAFYKPKRRKCFHVEFIRWADIIKRCNNCE
ncbi:hypothetical protein L1F30_01115 [Simiduia sp. 21SJ11W-1]|uniref:hypothetical protein n=1 Tax=Simiduia sp. 21SJ11W-1 TaxID=2909669 RepID=UPI00209EAC69|nr:hypothetical protein [Simiduia sp. 21SJ11W-1]UTA48156.1 hypothetical protein L1F30_01115 [Simiduia sp. 21SJ11W-1]